MAYLRNLGSNTIYNGLILAFANFLSVFLIFNSYNQKKSLNINNHLVVPSSRNLMKHLVLWSVSYTFCYGIFTIFPNDFTLSHLLISESIVPLIALWTSGDSKRITDPIIVQILAIIASILLVVLAALQSKHNTPSLNPLKQWGLLFLVTVGFLISQNSARILAQFKTLTWIQPRFSFLNAIGLVIFFALTGHFSEVHFTSHSLFEGCFLGLLILGVQYFYIVGLKHSPPLLSALMISTAVPLSLLTQTLWEKKPLTLTEILISLAYCISASSLPFFRNDRVVKTNE